ncbi:BirA family transcriptional regulator, biotin operon repressor / biotin-[acetyl-CoA-carboxylase] ligase [Georgenia satyanarayanai]|uniref:biotin--[biotin carboxyl-carrier protein] ligase n=1 Tax=Georgenia satyanarayanai TaxID=860221 RepID=A0A2Y9APG8_9MICO|nr:biotin--[acetyl-CoA-carboxylase] ligase [Georgenia satyanarayanai]PYF96785.1 BirA family biotin operon repressor/biotin-[acetyl-CoA-carboxylase] ligase [Georgenia satyanarayanai]SSA46381.1 BirA family transcriptional regulator, biotin operon repressor / biotin-[acetyl-CoA-carboxylase] ligase [Georgenia satyanarayanai]
MTEQPFTRVLHLAEVGSTSTALREAVAADPGAWPHLSALVADHQTAGRGRTGRSWHTPPGAALTASLLLRPRVPLERAPWLTLLAGLAVVRAVRAGGGDRAHEVGLKWPNDVLVDDGGPALAGWGTARKLGGILTELLPPSVDGRPVAVVGIGVNLSQDAVTLPVASATSLAIAGLPVPAPAALLHAVGHELGGLVRRWEEHDGDAHAAGLLAEVTAVCLTLGRDVRVEQPGGAVLHGRAESLDGDGCLVVRDAAGVLHRVLAGDVLHVRADAGSVEGGSDVNLEL